jgi:hypothetical protein
MFYFWKLGKVMAEYASSCHCKEFISLFVGSPGGRKPEQSTTRRDMHGDCLIGEEFGLLLVKHNEFVTRICFSFGSEVR